MTAILSAVSVSVCLAVCLSGCLCLSMSGCLSVSSAMSDSLCLWLSQYVWLFVSVAVSVCLAVCLSGCLSMSGCLCLWLSRYVSLSLSLCLPFCTRLNCSLYMTDASLRKILRATDVYIDVRCLEQGQVWGTFGGAKCKIMKTCVFSFTTCMYHGHCTYKTRMDCWHWRWSTTEGS